MCGERICQSYRMKKSCNKSPRLLPSRRVNGSTGWPLPVRFRFASSPIFETLADARRDLRLRARSERLVCTAVGPMV